jgi:hypothetical protein
MTTAATGWSVKVESAREADVDGREVALAASIFFDPDGVHMLQALPSGEWRYTNGSDVVTIARSMGRFAKGVYWTLNSVSAPLNYCLKSSDVARRRWFLIDLDRTKSGGTKESNATEADKDAIREVAGRIRDDLASRGWPSPVIVDSGNGYHLLYRIDMQADDAAQMVLRECLKKLAALFDTAAVHVDKATHDAKRISKLPGTWARKGPHSVDRPHRLAKILSAPDPVEAVPLEMLAALAGLAAGGPADIPGIAQDIPGTWQVPVGGDGKARESAYLRAAMEGELGRLALATPNVDRNTTLNKAAFALAQLVGAGLDDAMARGRLYHVARMIGLEEREIERTIGSGWSAGERTPRSIPAPSPANGHVNGHVAVAAAAPGATQAQDESWVDEGGWATLADVRSAISSFQYLWKLWIPAGAITTLAADGGTGKSVIAAKLCKMAWDGADWPDGSPATIPAGRPSIWLCYDRAWQGLMRNTRALGLPDEAIILPTRRGTPLHIPDMDHPGTMPFLGRLIARVNPWAVVIDSATYATGFNVAKANEAKLAFSPLMGMMAEHGVACISISHLSAEGKVLNRRPSDLSRSVIKVKSFGEDRKRLRIWVDKTDDERPPALGATIGGDGLIAFDGNPPGEDDDDGQSGRRGNPGTKIAEFAGWLHSQLKGAAGGIALAKLIDESREAGYMAAPSPNQPKPTISNLYKAKDRIPKEFPGCEVEELSVERGGKNGRIRASVKLWRLVQPESPLSESDDDFDPDKAF